MNQSSERDHFGSQNSQFSLEAGLLYYEGFSKVSGGGSKSSYVMSAETQAELAKIQDGNVVLEIGCGSGNSTLPIVQRCFPHGRVVAVDRSDIATIAGRKFGQVKDNSWNGRTSGIPVRPEVLAGVESVRDKTARMHGSVIVARAKAQELPLPSKTVDAAVMVQAFHWLAYEDDDTKGDKPSYVGVSLKEIHRVLKPGSPFVFDTAGGHLDFGDMRINGARLNSLHFIHHPVQIAFAKKLNTVFAENGFTARVDPLRPNKYYRIFPVETIHQLLKDAGFQPESISDQPFKISFVPLSPLQLLEGREQGGHMVYFTDPEVSSLPHTTKTQLLMEAGKRVREKHPDLLNGPLALEFLVFFKATAV